VSESNIKTKWEKSSYYVFREFLHALDISFADIRKERMARALSGRG